MTLDFFVSLGLSLLGLICFIVTFFRTGSIKKSIKEVLGLKLKINKATQLPLKDIVSQSFSEEKDCYILNSQTNELELLPTKKNIQELITSSMESCLERALEKFLPKEVIEDKLYNDYTQKVDDLSAIGEAIEVAEEYRERFGLSDNMSLSDIYSYVDKQAQSLKSKLDELNKSKEVSDNVEKKENS